MFKIKRIFKYTLLFALVFGVCQCGQAKEKGNGAKKENKSQKDLQKAPGFVLKKVMGEEELALSDLSGKVVVLDFWATWCPPCRMAIPSLNDLDEKYRGEGLEVVGMSLDRIRDINDQQKLKNFIQNYSMKYPIVYVTQEVRNLYGGIPSIPTVFILDRSGSVVTMFKGFSESVESGIENTVKQLL
jgi:thiol-disulfide isomerase/thioredoxin